MAIDNNIIDAGAVSSRKQNRQVVLRQAAAIPPQSYPVKNENGFGTVFFPQTPQRLGQMVSYRPLENSQFSSQMYVVVSVDGILVWKQVVSGVTFIDGDTGKKWDPNSQFPTVA